MELLDLISEIETLQKYQVEGVIFQELLEEKLNLLAVILNSKGA